jgi:hypothetical protein
MIRYTYNLSLVTADAARAIVGKKLSHVITTAAMLDHWTDLYTVAIMELSDGSKKISITNVTDRAEKYIHITSGKNGAIASAFHDYFSGDGREKTSTRFIFRDWTIPGAKKLEQIIRKTF